MSLFLEGSAYDMEDCEFIKELQEVLKKGKFETKIEYHRDGNVKIQYRKELLAIVDMEIIQVLKGFNETSEEVWNSKFFEDRETLLKEYTKRVRDGGNE